jgi:hypothetical protein
VKPAVKIGLVAAGYLGAFLIAAAAVAIRVASTSGPEAQASSGMYAFGDAVLFVGVFALLALAPTAAALYWLRPYRTIWIGLASVAVAVASTGAVGAAIFALGRYSGPASMLGALSVLRILLACILAPTFLVVALIAPSRGPRVALLAAAAIELAVVMVAAFSWFVPLYFPAS